MQRIEADLLCSSKARHQSIAQPKKNLEQLAIDGTGPPIAKACLPARQLECVDLLPDYSGVDEQYPE